MDAKFLIAPLTAVATIIGVGTIVAQQSERDLELSPERFYAIKKNVEAAPEGSIIIFGDSIVQVAPLPRDICGRDVINGGVAGATVGYFERHALELLGAAQPGLIVLAVGINNASTEAARHFQSQYYSTVSDLARASPVAVSTITPIRSNVGSVGYDSPLVPVLNDYIVRTPNARLVIDINGPLSSDDFTSDGIHLDAAGYSLWT